ncbi:GbNV_gp19-like protein [Crangon crangon nudivirus]|uniref:GbNV_gp19-like protein n=1 Tax=Crangon crangon nudivirus TaxID=2880838 RepID=A0AAE8Y3E2_9VIRU|nr:GbNV_gp19-like protein [Crangon crangon nudivirus]UBZ25583.1 GbNV_gp19-like protein [Crangon crangon nudivirus]
MAPIETARSTMDGYRIFTLLITILLVVMILTISYMLVYPKVPIDYIRDKFQVLEDPEVTKDSAEVYTYTSASAIKPGVSFTCHVYIWYPPKVTEGILVFDIPGGAFINSSNTLKPYIHMPNLPYTVVSLEYPIVPKATAKLAIEYLENVMLATIEKYKVKWDREDISVYLCCASAGSYYGVKIINNNKLAQYVKKYSSVSGYFGYKTMDHLIATICDRVYLRQFKENVELDCMPIPEGLIDTFYAISEYDKLADSTLAFVGMTSQQDNVMTYKVPSHSFYLYYNCLDTQAYYQDLVTFLTES